MNQPHRKLGCAMTLLMTIGVATPGCDTGLALDTTTGDPLSVLTSGDLAGAFNQFIATASRRFADGGVLAGLTSEQTSEIEALQSQLDAGSIDSSEFAQQVREVLGDRAPNLAFGGFGFGGSPFGFGRGIGGTDPLDLSEEQRRQASEIFGQLHSGIADLRSAAHEEIQVVLTDEQLATLEAMRTERLHVRSSRFGRGRPSGSRIGGGASFSDQFSNQLGLSEEQDASIEEIRRNLRASVMDRHTEAREAFIALLTPEQVALLDELEA